MRIHARVRTHCLIMHIKIRIKLNLHVQSIGKPPAPINNATKRASETVLWIDLTPVCDHQSRAFPELASRATTCLIDPIPFPGAQLNIFPFRWHLQWARAPRHSVGGPVAIESRSQSRDHASHFPCFFPKLTSTEKANSTIR